MLLPKNVFQKLLPSQLPFVPANDSPRSTGIYVDTAPEGHITALYVYKNGQAIHAIEFDPITFTGSEQKITPFNFDSGHSYFEEDGWKNFDGSPPPTLDQLEQLSMEEADRYNRYNNYVFWLKDVIGYLPSVLEETKYDPACSFCAKKQHEVRKLVAGPNCYICNECAEMTYEITRIDSTPPSKITMLIGRMRYLLSQLLKK